MAIREGDVLGKVPEPLGGAPVVQGKVEGDEIEKVIKLRRQTAALRALEEPPVPAVQESPIRMNFDIGSMFTSMQAMATDILKQYVGAGAEAERERYGKFSQDLQNLREEWRGRPGQAAPRSEIEIYREMKTIERELAEEIRKSMPVAAVPPAGEGNLVLLVELKKIDLQMQQERLRHEAEMEKWKQEAEERRRQWALEHELEEKRFRSEIAFRQAEFQDGKDNRSRAGNALSTILGAWGNSLDAEAGGEAKVVAGDGAGALAVRVADKETTIDCESCNTRIAVPAGTSDGSQVSCPSCKASYTVNVT